MLHSVLHLRQKNVERASETFSAAATEAESLLDSSVRNYKAIDSKGFALCGLAICEENRDHLKKARQAFLQARKINSDKGYVKRVLRLFDRLSEMDRGGVLNDVRKTLLEAKHQ